MATATHEHATDLRKVGQTITRQPSESPPPSTHPAGQDAGTDARSFTLFHSQGAMEQGVQQPVLIESRGQNLAPHLIKQMQTRGWSYVDQVRGMDGTPRYVFTRQDPDGTVRSIEEDLPGVVVMADGIPSWRETERTIEQCIAEFDFDAAREHVRQIPVAHRPDLYKRINAAEAARLPPGGTITPDYVFKRPLILNEQPPYQIAIDDIVSGRWQPRGVFHEESIRELAESLEAHGLLTPIKVFFNERDQYELIAGERRFRAARLLGWTTITADVVEWTARQIQEVAIIDNLQREDLSPVEEGRAFDKLIANLGISEAEAARRTGKPRTYIQQRRAIATGAPELQDALASGAITMTHARAIAMAAPGDHKVQAKALTEIRARMTDYGRNVSEKDARERTEKQVYEATRKKLEKLGWQLRMDGSALVVWAAAERPRRWTGAELLEALRNERRPGGEPSPPAKVMQDDTLVIRAWGYQLYDTYAPWVHVSQYNMPSHFLAPSEVPAFAADLRAQLEAMQQRYAAAGWTLTIDGSRFAVESSAGRQERVYAWSNVEGLIAKIEAGEIAAAPPKQQRITEYKQECVRCKKKTSDYRYVGDGYHCKPCATLREQEIAAKRAELRRQIVEAGAEAWLASAPEDVLRLLVLTRTASAWTKRVLESSVEYLRAQVLDNLEAAAYDHHVEQIGTPVEAVS